MCFNYFFFFKLQNKAKKITKKTVTNESLPSNPSPQTEKERKKEYRPTPNPAASKEKKRKRRPSQSTDDDSSSTETSKKPTPATVTKEEKKPQPKPKPKRATDESPVLGKENRKSDKRRRRSESSPDERAKTKPTNRERRPSVSSVCTDVSGKSDVTPSSRKDREKAELNYKHKRRKAEEAGDDNTLKSSPVSVFNVLKCL